jgi:hypothetical protein
MSQARGEIRNIQGMSRVKNPVSQMVNPAEKWGVEGA